MPNRISIVGRRDRHAPASAASEATAGEIESAMRHGIRDVVSRANQIALQATRDLVVRQGAVIDEAFDRLVAPTRESVLSSDRPSISETRCAEIILAQSLAHTRALIDAAAELNRARVEALSRQLATMMARHTGSTAPEAKRGQSCQSPRHG